MINKNKIKLRSKIIPKLMLMASLAPQAYVANANNKNQWETLRFDKGLVQSISEEQNIELACAFTCGRSCGFTDNC